MSIIRERLGGARSRCRPRFALGLGTLAAALLLGPAAAEAQFTQDFTRNVHGDVKLAGNSLVTCDLSQQACIDALGDTNADNDDITAEYIDVDGDAATFSSSSATLSIPAGAKVLHAQLVWGGHPPADPVAEPIDEALIDTPASSGYVPVPADETLSGTPYHSVADVTSLVAAGGAGSYTVANVGLKTAAMNSGGGWSLLVAYRDNSEPWRNLSIYKGTARVSTVSPQTIVLSGLVTPEAPVPVSAQLGIVIWEGDAGDGGDRMLVNGTELDLPPEAPAGNFFRSRITDLGSLVTDRDPNPINNLGYEWKRIDVSDLMQNGDTSIETQFTTSSAAEGYGVDAFSAAIRIVGPKLVVRKRAGKKRARPGEVVPYRIAVRNRGGADAIRVRVCDQLPDGLKVVRAPGGNISRSGRKVCWSVGKLAFGTQQKLRVVAQVGTGVRPGKRLRNKAAATSRNARTRRDSARVQVLAVPAGPCGVVRARC